MYLHDQVPENHHYANLKATPVIPTSPEMWMLGSSGRALKLLQTTELLSHLRNLLMALEALKL